MGSGVRVRHLPFESAHPFARAVWEGSVGLPPLPRDDAGWRRAADEAAARSAPLPAAAAARLAARQEALAGDAGAVAAAHALGRPGTLAVVTGQQPGLLGGPLLTLHKAAGALALARALEARVAARVVPVFWLASEDHDLDEANRVWLLDRDGQPRRLTVDLPAPDGRSLFDLDVPVAATDAFLEDVRAVLPDTDRAREVLNRLARRPGEECATWCGRDLLALLGASGLVLLEPPVLQPHAGEVLADVLERAGAVREALRAGAGALERAGFEAPLDPAPDEAPLFLREAPGRPRQRVRVDGDGRVRRGSRGGDGEAVDAVAAAVRADPTLASGDATGRVFVQNALLPVLAYVGGPTELAYHVQVKAAHDALGRRYPLAVPRPEATWVDAKAARAAEAFGLSLDTVIQDPEALARRAAETPGEEALEAPLARWIEAVGTPPPAVAALLDPEGDANRQLVSAAHRLGREAAKAADRVRAGDARDRGVGADRRRRLEDLVRPRGRPQERSLSPVSLAARHGFEALREGLAHLDPLRPGHYVVDLG